MTKNTHQSKNIDKTQLELNFLYNLRILVSGLVS